MSDSAAGTTGTHAQVMSALHRCCLSRGSLASWRHILKTFSKQCPCRGIKGRWWQPWGWALASLYLGHAAGPGACVGGYRCHHGATLRGVGLLSPAPGGFGQPWGLLLLCWGWWEGLVCPTARKMQLRSESWVLRIDSQEQQHPAFTQAIECKIFSLDRGTAHSRRAILTAIGTFCL